MDIKRTVADGTADDFLDFFELVQPERPVDPLGPEVALTVHHWAAGGVDEKIGVDAS